MPQYCLVLDWMVLLSDGRTWASIDDVASGRYAEWTGCYVQARRRVAWFLSRAGIAIVPRAWILDALHPAKEDEMVEPQADEPSLFANEAAC